MIKIEELLDEAGGSIQKKTDEIINILSSSKNIAVISHIEPDGDAIGSQLALTVSLEQNGWTADAFNDGPFNNMFLKKNKKHLKKNIEKKYDLYMIVDTPSIERIGKNLPEIDLERTVVIDHHPTNPGYGKINLIDERFISTCEIVFLLLLKMGIGLDDEEVCQHLLNGIISDNGYFNHIKKQKHFSLLASYFLINRGADPKKSLDLLYCKKTIGSKKIFGLAVERMETIADGRVVWTYLYEKDKKKFRDAVEDSSLLYKEMLSIAGVEIAIYFKVKNDRVDISFRSGGKYDVSLLAAGFGGGGHKEASGASITKDFSEVKKEVLEAACRLMK